jgi:predicted PhzF superfamily epimerase YddE/YHI9
LTQRGANIDCKKTGAAAAAIGAYLRAVGAIEPPARVTILQGHDMGRPSRLLVDIDTERPEIQVTGNAVPIAAR